MKILPLHEKVDIPRLIAGAHSARFESQAQGIALLEQALITDY